MKMLIYQSELGDLLRIRKDTHLKLTEMSKIYGKVYRIWMGDYYTIVVSDPAFIKKVWAKNFNSFVDRPHTAIYQIMSRKFRSLVGGDEVIWRHNRHLVSSSFTKTSLRSLTTIYNSQAAQLMTALTDIAKSGQVWYPRKYLRKFTLNIIFRLLFSEELPYEEGVEGGLSARLTKPIDRIFRNLAGGSAWAYLDVLGAVAILMRKWNGVPKDGVIRFVEEMFDKHKLTLDRENPKDLFDHMIIESETSENSKESMMLVAVDFIIAGTETSSSTIEWFIAMMINHPEIQAKARAELQNAVGAGNKVVELSHRVKTPYFAAVCKEVLRIKPIVSLGLPRAAKESIMIDDIFIPKGTQMVMNIYGLHHDKDIYERPEEFMPERFLVEVPMENYIPFSTGQRDCIGKNLAADEIYTGCSNLLLNFKLSSTTGEPVDVSDIYGLAIHPNIFGVKLEPVV
eukprot:gene15470-18363_t